MSHVTDVILTLGVLEESLVDSDRCPCVESLNAWLFDRGRGTLNRVDDFAGGHKAAQAVVFMGAFNALDIPGFIAAVDSISWEDRECLALFIKDEHELRFTDRTT